MEKVGFEHGLKIFDRSVIPFMHLKKNFFLPKKTK